MDDPSDRPGQILVYRYRYWDEDSKGFKNSRVFATMIAIKQGLGLPIFESAIWVPRVEVDGGIYSPSSPTSTSTPQSREQT